MLELYKNIRKRRIELGMSQTELAKRVGYSDRSSIAKIESGKVDLSQTKIMEIADALRVPAGDLMGLDGVEEADFTVTLSEEESQLLEKFHRLSATEQLLLVQMMDTLLNKEG